jgi:hypothetical protein
MSPEDSKALRPGDRVEWLHKKGGWRPAKFLEYIPERGSLKILTELGCEVYRRCEFVRVYNPQC